MSFPNKLSIIGREYNVVYSEPTATLMGQCDCDGLKIEIKPGQLLPLEADTVLHEVIHAIENSFQLKMNERQVYCMATGLIAVFKNNPDFLEYMYKAIKQ
jgi:hypothetical protein